jgi:hypothetical protein
MYNFYMNEFNFSIPNFPRTDEDLDKWLELLNQAPAGYAPEWRKEVLKALVNKCHQKIEESTRSLVKRA